MADAVDDGFAKAAEAGQAPEIESGFERDEWKVLLFFAYHHELPQQFKEKSNVQDFVDVWALADFYKIRDLRDLVMLELLRLDSTHDYPVGDIKTLCCSIAYSVESDLLLRFMGEMVVREVEVRKSLWLVNLDGCMSDLDSARAIIKAYHRFNKYGKEIFDRFGEGEVTKEWWKKFMVGDGPKQHWVHEKVAEGAGRKRRRVE